MLCHGTFTFWIPCVCCHCDPCVSSVYCDCCQLVDSYSMEGEDSGASLAFLCIFRIFDWLQPNFVGKYLHLQWISNIFVTFVIHIISLTALHCMTYYCDMMRLRPLSLTNQPPLLLWHCWLSQLLSPKCPVMCRVKVKRLNAMSSWTLTLILLNCSCMHLRHRLNSKGAVGSLICLQVVKGWGAECRLAPSNIAIVMELTELAIISFWFMWSLELEETKYVKSGPGVDCTS